MRIRAITPWGCCLFLGMALNLAAAESAPKITAKASDAGEVRTAQIMSPALRAAIDYLVYLPPGYDPAGGARYPVLYLLHGRGDKLTAWMTIKPDLDRMISAGQIPPVIAVMPDAPSSRRAGYYIDSQFTGSADGKLPPGAPVETAFIKELLTHIDATHPTRTDRAGRIVAGYSLFGAAIILSPAVYFPLPPPDSSTREFGAFGKGAKQFDDDIYTALNYPATIPAFVASGLPLVMFIAVGDDEQALANPAEAAHDLDYEAHTLYNRIRRVPKITSQLRVVDGPHDWATWRPTFIEGVQYVVSQLKPAAVATTPTH
jgi:enterochelin esterase-like enzyme